MISTIDGVLRNHREEVGQHRLADLIDPVRILDDEQRRLVRASAAALISAVNRRRRASGSICGQRHIGVGDAQQIVEQQQILRVGIGNVGPAPARGRLRSSRSATPVPARSSRVTAWNGISRAWDSQKAQNTSTPRPAATAAASRAIRLLPMPGGPTTFDHTTAATDRAVHHGVDGGHLPAPTDQGAPRHARPAPPARPIAHQPTRGHRVVGALDAHPLRFGQRQRCARPVARWTPMSITPPGGATDSIRCAIPTCSPIAA